MAWSAMRDGHRGSLDAAQLEDHISTCDDCRSNVERLGELMQLLDGQKRQVLTGQLWSSIEGRLPERSRSANSSRDLRLLVPIGAVLLAYKLFEQLADGNTALLIKIVPLLLVIVVFGVLKENPFRINPELGVKGE